MTVKLDICQSFIYKAAGATTRRLMLTLVELEKIAKRQSLAALLKVVAESRRDWEIMYGNESVEPRAARDFQLRVCLILNEAIRRRGQEVGAVRLGKEFDILFQAADDRGVLGTPGLNMEECARLIQGLPPWILLQLRACRSAEELHAIDVLHEHELGSISERGDVPSTYGAMKKFLIAFLEDIDLTFTHSHLSFHEHNEQVALDATRRDKRLTLELEADHSEIYSLTLTLELLDREFLGRLPYPPAISRQMCEVSFQALDAQAQKRWKIKLADMPDWVETDERTWKALFDSLLKQFSLHS